MVLEEVDGRRLRSSVEAHDAADRVCAGRHERFVVNRARFQRRAWPARRPDRPRA